MSTQDSAAFNDEENAFNPNQQTQVKVPTRGNPDVVPTPGPANALVCKILQNPNRNGEVYYEVELIKHMVGTDPKKDTRYHLSRKMLGERSPENDKFWELHNKLKALEEAGKKSSEEYRVLKTEKETFQASKKFLLLVLPLGETKPKALEVTWKGIKKLFGAPKTATEPAYTGIIETMRAKGRDPLSLVSEKGWLRIWRTGTGLETDWHVAEETVDSKDASGDDVTKPMIAKVSDTIFKLKKSDIIDLTTIHRTSQMLWTEAECQNFVDTCGVNIPDRCKKRSNNNDTSSDGNSSAFGAPSAVSNSLTSNEEFASAVPEDGVPFDLDNVF